MPHFKLWLKVSYIRLYGLRLLDCSGPTVQWGPKVTFSLESMKNPLLTKLVWTRWLDIDKKTTTTIIFGHLDLTLGQKCNNEFLSHTITNQRKTKQRRTKFEPTKNWTTTHLHVGKDKTCLITVFTWIGITPD